MYLRGRRNRPRRPPWLLDLVADWIVYVGCLCIILGVEAFLTYCNNHYL